MNDICLNLLRYNMCIDNEYFRKYKDLVNRESVIMPDGIHERHHIVPRAVYKILGIDVDNSADNLINLNIKDHVLAHYYLSLCSTNSKFKFSNITCISLICNRNYSYIDEYWINSNLEYLENLRKEQRRLNSLMQKGLQAGDNNPNCKVTLAISSEVKELLLSGFTSSEISDKLNIPERLVKLIINGTHWTCKEDGFKFDIRAYKKDLAKAEWVAEKHRCIYCDKVMVEKYKNGRFCSAECSSAYRIKNRAPAQPKKPRRSYVGEMNPNYGKKASPETRKKISEGIKRTGAYSSRFAGHKHTDESRKKTSESLKKRYQEKRKLLNKLNEDN